MSRRRHTQSDSLDLLLDTICNTFGGILFIAILVVLLLQFSDEQRPTEPQNSTNPDEVLRQRLALSQLQGELQSLAKARAGQERLIEQFAPEEIQELLRERNDLQEHVLASLEAEHATLEQNATLVEENERRRLELQTIHKRLNELRAEVEELEATLAEDRKQRTHSIGVPVVRANPYRNEVAVILRYGRMYFWHRYDSFGRRAGLNTDDFVVLSDEDGQLETRAIPTGGLPLTDEASTRQLIRQSFSRFDSTNYVVAVVVRPDSFEQFRILRDELKGMGHDFRLMPLSRAVRDRGGVGGRFQ